MREQVQAMQEFAEWLGRDTDMGNTPMADWDLMVKLRNECRKALRMALARSAQRHLADIPLPAMLELMVGLCEHGHPPSNLDEIVRLTNIALAAGKSDR